jgi:glycosyltransferase involved in cell wall biosynthesis
MSAAPVSVIICAFNRPARLRRALLSVWDQTLRPAETIVVDDGSTPPLALADDWVRVIRHTRNLGPAAARNRAMAAATSPFLAFLDSDDLWRPEKLERQAAMLAEAGDDLIGVFTAFRRHGAGMRGGVVRTPAVRDWRRFFLMGLRSGPGSTLMIRRTAYEAVGGFDGALRRYEDWDWLLRASRRFRFAAIDEVLADVHQSGRPSAEQCRDALRIIEARHLPEIGRPSERRLFKAALALERAAVARWDGRSFDAFVQGLRALAAPALLRRELGLTLNV